MAIYGKFTAMLGGLLLMLITSEAFAEFGTILDFNANGSAIVGIGTIKYNKTDMMIYKRDKTDKILFFGRDLSPELKAKVKDLKGQEVEFDFESNGKRATNIRPR